ncbi:hypothetical protein [Chryseobacterium sp. c4a]|uniref:hypothetical protein n=1 Tax=Chryseobacterium sp. c4a TaxID=1573582 RepID=UPI00135B79A1|nr:hypothetical protein [Chryseobacterium sp. c4a]
MKTVIYYLEKLYNTIKANGIYIFLSVFFVFLLFVVSDVSDDFIYALSDKENVSNVFFIALAFTLLALSLWVIPASFLKVFLGRNISNEEVLFYYQGFEDIYNGKKNEKRNQIPVKYIAILPWVTYTVTLGVCLIKSIFAIESVWVIFLCLLFISFYILNFLNKKFNVFYNFFTKNKTRKRLLDSFILVFFIVAVLPLVIFLISFRVPYLEPSSSLGYNIFLILLIIYNVICILATFLFLLYKEKEPGNVESKYNFSKILHRSTIFISISLLLIFSIFSLNSKLIWISPTVILIIISTVFILGFELLYTIPRIIIIIEHYKTGKLEGKYDKQRYIFYGVIILVGIILAIQPDKTIYMLENKNTSREKLITTCNDGRDKLEDYFFKWLNNNHQYNDLENTEPIDVYLISGEGGGSTAGSWLLSNLLNVEAANPQFYNNLFSISTVSGSSNGANFYFAIKTNNILPLNGDKEFMDDRYKFVSELYTTNYFSSNFLGLMFSDYFINPIAASIRNKNIDRNYILQQEEKNAMVAASYTVNSKYLKSVEDYFDQNYLDLWYGDKAGAQKQLNPLFFINTTLMEKGEKAIFSPVRPDDLELRARDIVKEFASKDENKGYYIPISAAVAQSQAFPMLSTYNEVPGTGHLGDGGFYENTGTSTTLAIYKRLKKYYKEHLLVNENPKRKIRFTLVNFISAPSSKKDDGSFDFLKNSMLRYTIAQTYKTPINGHAKDALGALDSEVKSNNLQYKKDNRDEETDKFLNIVNSEEFATTRLISKKTINKMFVYRKDNEKEGAGAIIEALKKADSARNTKISKVNNGASVSMVYIHYSNNANKTNPKLIKNLENYISNEVIIANSKDSQKRYMFRVQGVQNIPSFDINQIRYFHKGDEDIANMLCEEFRKKGIILETRYFNYNNFKYAVLEGKLEIWVDQVPKPKPDKKDVKK